MPSRSPALEGLRLLCALVSPFSTRDPLLADWPAVTPWGALLAQADTHRLIPALSVALARHGLGDRVDAELADVLAAVAAWNTERNEGFRRQMRTLGEALNAAGVQPVWLKGALSLLPPDGPAAGRQMMDLDMWVPGESQRRVAMGVLRSLGYASDGPEESRRHYPPFFHPDEMARVELHHSVIAPHDALLPGDIAAGVEWLDWEGQRIGRLDPLSRALCSLAQCTSPLLYTRLATAEVPLVKVLDLVGRIHDDFGGVVPPAFIARVRAAGWERPTQRLLTLTEACFGLPNPLPADPAQLRMLERFTRLPRWHLTLRATQALMGGGGRRILRAPWQAPGMVARYVRGLIAPRAPKEL
ncbi:putative nucleotidyltransferase-like protein [Ancylobacter aquaticus]|uniref:Putative nucleotidyltransferase-like protein n=1 Tax=Ancylobacter aquaticus TaxID=100 RepID=A0A4R1IB64_ANCAQ|nr:nucleotidyltransferase family protein [Ancylobacter aquaticus]TCK30269.1 putative nucleotidyltransferase-like protein [Ancylobacter aquaticus]